MPNHIPAYNKSPLLESIDCDGYELLFDLRATPELSTVQRRFVDELQWRALTSPTAFNKAFSPETLMERVGVERRGSEALDRLCQAGVELLRADDADTPLHARRVCEAAELLLARGDSEAPASHRLAKSMRQAARATLQERIDARLASVGATPLGSPERASALRAHAIDLARCFGVHRGSGDLGADLVLDAQGKVAYAFRPLMADTLIDLCLARHHASVATVISASGLDQALYMGRSTGELVALPGRWCDAAGGATPLAAALHPLHAAAEAEATATVGVLMPAPADFDLSLPLDDLDGPKARSCVAKALSDPLGTAALRRLHLAAMVEGTAEPDLSQVLVDPHGQFWILDHHAFLSGAPPEITAARSPALAQTLAEPLGIAQLRALTTMGADDPRPHLVKRGTPSRRELNLIAEALEDSPLADVNGVSTQIIDRVCEASRHAGHWAEVALRAQAHLHENAESDIDDLVAAVNLQRSLSMLALSMNPEQPAQPVAPGPADGGAA